MVLVDIAAPVAQLLSLGVFGFGLASWLGGDEEAGIDESGEDEFAMDDEFGMGDFDDDFGGMDDLDADGDASSSELEHRIEDLESEIANVSSTANTVRSENEQISEKVDDVEENVRKLLEIYEMVTRGVNPFVDDVNAGAGMGQSTETFGLFASEEESAGEDEADDLDADIADAEAEDFFDDDAFDDMDEDEAEEPGDDGLVDDEMDSSDDALQLEDSGDSVESDLTGGFDEESGDAADSGGGGTSFEELKAEYESGEADWADDLDEDPDGDDDVADEPSAGGPSDDPEDLFIEDDLTGDEAVGSPSGSPASTDTTPETAESASGAHEEAHSEKAHSEGDADTGFEFGAASLTAGASRPRLERPPNGYLADVVILEWLDFLVDAYDARNAVRAINYYERIGWIGEPMRDHCVALLLGITDAEYIYRDEFGTTDISMSDHRKSLRYVEELASGQLEKGIVDRLDTRATDGI